MCKTCTEFSTRPFLQNDMDAGAAAALSEKEADDLLPIARAQRDEARRERDVLRQERDEARKFATAEHVRATEAERERDHWKREADGANADLADLRAAEPRPLTPDAITDEMVERARKAWNRSAALGNDLWRDVLTAAIVPTRPEGAEELAAAIAEWDETGVVVRSLDQADTDELADHLAALGYRKTP